MTAFLLVMAPGVSSSQTVKITLLGTGGPEPIMERFSAATLIQAGEEILLFECGEGRRVAFVATQSSTRRGRRCVSDASSFRPRRGTGADVVIHEVMAARPELLRSSTAAERIVALHTSPEDAGRVFAQVRPRLAIYSHIVLLTTDAKIPAPSAEELVERTRTTYTGPLLVEKTSQQS